MKTDIAGRIFLAGFMGAGKTSVGRSLADITGYSFIDSDEEIEHNCGLPVHQIFEQKGEAYFRQQERKTVAKLLKSRHTVVALGGGALQDETITEKIKQESLLAFIDCPISVIFKRIKDDKQRPLLLTENNTLKEPEPLKRDLRNLYRQRLPLYRKADIIIDSSNFTGPLETAVYLKKKIKAHAD